MPGRVFVTTPLAELAALAGVPAPDWSDPPRLNASPGQDLAVLTEDGFQRMRWGLIPQGRVNARGRPVMETIVNARSETVFDKSAFDGVRRAVVPVDGWYEWTGKTRRKTAWAIRAKAGTPLWFAAIFDVWNGPGGLAVPQVATITCEPNADVRDIHHRMGVILDLDRVPLWLTGDEAVVADLMRPWPDGQLVVSQAEDVDWTGP